MKHLFDNPMIAGAIGIMLSGAAMYMLRNVPIAVLRWVWYRAVAEIAIYSDNAAFHWAEEWLSSQPYSKKTKHLMVSHAADNERTFTLVPGSGLHLFWDGWRPIWYRREDLNKESGPRTVSAPTNKIVISTLDIGRKTVEKIYRQIRDSAESRQSLRVFTCSSWGHWSLLLKREHRLLSSVFVDAAVKERILGHIRWYLANKNWYVGHGIPYRTGVLLYGPPGTGKTSLIHAIAGEFDLSVYIMNPADLDSENALRFAMATIQKRSILLIEDADTSISSRRVETKPTEGMVTSSPTNGPVLEGKGPTLSGVLNALDGIAAADGRVLFLTTNHIERLDPALIRDGRIDMKIELGELQDKDALEMASTFFPDRGDHYLADLVKRNGPKTGAAWQTFFADMSKPTLLKKVI